MIINREMTREIPRAPAMKKGLITLIKGDITKLSVDAIVNAANTTLMGGGGVDGAIHKAAGKELLEECKNLCGCTIGQAKMTKGYHLPARYIIHTVGPVWRGGNKGEFKLLASCYFSCLKLANHHQLKTIAFPAISCGVFGFPVDKAAMIAIKEIASFMESHDGLQEVIFVTFNDTVYAAYQDALDSFYHE